MSSIGMKVVDTICDSNSELTSKRLCVATADAGCPDAVISAEYTGRKAVIKSDDCFIVCAQSDMQAVIGTSITDATQRAVTTLNTFRIELSAKEFFSVSSRAQARRIPTIAAIALRGALAAFLILSTRVPKILAGVKRESVFWSPFLIPALLRALFALSGTFRGNPSAPLCFCCSLIMLSREAEEVSSAF
jgi:hypothetical protein